MKYWGYLAAKVIVWLGILGAIERMIARAFPQPLNLSRPSEVTTYLNYELVMLLFGLFAVGLAWLILWDQRYRCRTCLRRLRMPVQMAPGTTSCWARPGPTIFVPTDTAPCRFQIFTFTAMKSRTGSRTTIFGRNWKR